MDDPFDVVVIAFITIVALLGIGMATGVIDSPPVDYVTAVDADDD